MKKAALIAFGILTLTLIVGLVIRVPVKQDLNGVAALELTAIKMADMLSIGRERATHTTKITDPNDLKELNQLFQVVVWHSVFDLSAHEGWTEFYTLRFVRNGREEKINFSDTEWTPGGRTPPAVLAWVREKANQSTTAQRASRVADH